MAHLQTSPPKKNRSISIHDLYLVWLPGTLQPSTEVHDCRMIFITFGANWFIPLEELSSTILGTSICKEVKLCDLTDGWGNEAEFGYHPIFGIIFECFHVTSKLLLSLKIVVPNIFERLVQHQKAVQKSHPPTWNPPLLCWNARLPSMDSSKHTTDTISSPPVSRDDPWVAWASNVFLVAFEWNQSFGKSILQKL